MLSQNLFPSPLAWKRGTQLNIFDHSTLVDGQNRGRQELLEFGFKAALGLGGAEAVDGLDGRGEEHLVALEASGVSQGGRQVGLAHHAGSGMMGIMPGTGLCREV